MTLKNEAERLAAARRTGHAHGKSLLRKAAPASLRTQIERDAYDTAHTEGVANAHREEEERLVAQEEEDRNRPPPPPPDDVIKIRFNFLDAVLPRDLSIAVGRAVTRGDAPEYGIWGQSLIYGGEGRTEGVSFNLTEKQALLARQLCIAIVKELRLERQRGREDGHNMLHRLANGEITVDAYEERRRSDEYHSKR